MQSRESHCSSSSSTLSDDGIVEITLDVRDDSVALAVHSIKTAGGKDIEDPESALMVTGLDKKTSTLGTTSTRDIESVILRVSQELKRLLSFSNRPRRKEFDRTKSAATRALRGLKFISTTNSATDLSDLRWRFHTLTKYTEGLLRRAHFGMCIGMIKIPEYMYPKPEGKKSKDHYKKLEELRMKFKDYVPTDPSQDFAVQLFDALSRQWRSSSGFIDEDQLIGFWQRISDKSFDGRLQIFFDMVDKNCDGRITEEEVREIIASSASANILSNIKNRADEYAALIMEVLDPYNLGHIEIHDLEMLLLEDRAHLVRGDESKILSRMISQNLQYMSYFSPLRRWFENFKYLLLDNWQRVWVMALWIGVMAGLFAYKYIQYKNKAAFDVMGHCLCVAKGAAETLKLNMALILLPVCRNTITWLRNNTRLGVAVPFVDNLNFHKIIAIAIAIGVGIHGISHLACDFPRLLHATEEEYKPMEKYFGDQPTSYWWFVKGVEGVTGIIMVVLMAIAYTLASTQFRRNNVKLPKPFNKVTTGFNAFWYSHHLFVIVYALLIVHGIKLYLTKEWNEKTTWMYLAVPIVLYASERLLRAFRSSIKSVQIFKVVGYHGNVLALHMSKPEGFEYKSGQYMFVNCADVSPFEWHPFFISSAPGDDYLSVHIRALGDWTRQVKTVFMQVQNNPTLPKVLIDGPYGAPSQEYKKYDFVLLVGIGIGATPMISILKDIVNNMKADDEMSSLSEDGTNPSSSNGVRRGTQRGGGNYFRPRKAYFYWVTREQGSFEWFKEIMDEVAEMDHQEVIEMHIHCTSVYEEGDARSAVISMLQELNHDKNGVDVVSGTRVKSHFGRPNWRRVYKHISINHTNSKIGVFYCGIPNLVEELRRHASDFSQRTSSKFEFHKETF